MKKPDIIFWICASIFALFLVFAPYLPENAEVEPELIFFDVELLSVKGEVLEFLMLEGENAGEKIEIYYDANQDFANKIYSVGDRVQVSEFLNGDEVLYSIVDHSRKTALIILFCVFLAVLFFIGSWRGIFAFLGTGFSFLVLMRFVLPLLLQGFSPLLLMLVAGFMIVPVIFYGTHGVNFKSSLGMFVSLFVLLLSFLMAYLFSVFLHLSGAAGEESILLKWGDYADLDFRGLFLAGVLMGIIGILDDVVMTQISLTNRLHKLQLEVGESMSFLRLYSEAMNVGKDHISSIINTLFLVYAGASMPLLLLFFDDALPFMRVLQIEFVSEEIMRTLIGSMSLMLAAPLATALCAFYLLYGPGKQKETSAKVF